MYKLLLSWRYLRTRFIALASIISVTLGVATLIVVNSVMSGFVFEMKSRLHGILSDVEVAAPLLGQIHNPEYHTRIIRNVLGDDIESMTCVVRNPALLTFEVNGRQWTQQVMLLGIDDESFGKVTDFHPYLQNTFKREQFSFNLEEQGYPDWVATGCKDWEGESAWDYRRRKFQKIRQAETRRLEQERLYDLAAAEYLEQQAAKSRAWDANQADLSSEGAANANYHSVEDAKQPIAATQATFVGPQQPDRTSAEKSMSESGFQYVPLPEKAPDFAAIHAKKIEEAAEQKPSGITLAPTHFSQAGGKLRELRKFSPVDAHAEFRDEPNVEEFFNPEEDQYTGIILGLAIAKRKTIIDGELTDFYMVRPGDDVQIMFPTVGGAAKPISENCTLVDFYSSNMHEYDSSFAFVPLKELQKIRGMVDPLTGDASVSTIQIKLKEGANLDEARDKLIAQFPPESYPYDIHTWQDTQRPLLSAVNMELTILNLLLFMIIAVAGFGILATFFMIVVEKTKDIGVLKALGAPSSGVMSIFLGYGMALGLVGTGAGIILGLLFVRYINQIAAVVQMITGQEVFDPSIYYFSEIPTIVSPLMVLLVGLGAILIAVMASVLPALRAARLHPVEALRYE